MQVVNIIGTDTEIGKTYSACKIMEYLSSVENKTVTALKPIASGVIQSEIGLINEDVYQLKKFSNYELNINMINPFCFKNAIAPHIAAEKESINLNANLVIDSIAETIKKVEIYSHILIEGVGGLMVPLNKEETYLDLLIKLQFPVIIIVGIKLGCLNHAILTEQVLRLNNIHIVGWIANHIDPNMVVAKENIEFLRMKIPAPLLATIEHNGKLLPSKYFQEFFKCQ